MEHFTSNGLVIIGSLIVIISYLFNLLARRLQHTKRIAADPPRNGAAWNYLSNRYRSPDLSSILEVLGIIGLIMIVLEASLDLELTGEKRKLISRAFFTALVNLILPALLIAGGYHGLHSMWT